MQQRAFAEKAVAAEVDWESISSLIHSDEGKRELSSLRSTFMDIQSKLTGMSKDTPAPNWAEWKKDLDPKIVDGFKSAFDSTFPLLKAHFRLFSVLPPPGKPTVSSLTVFTPLLHCCSHEAPFIHRERRH